MFSKKKKGLHFDSLIPYFVPEIKPCQYLCSARQNKSTARGIPSKLRFFLTRFNNTTLEGTSGVAKSGQKKPNPVKLADTKPELFYLIKKSKLAKCLKQLDIYFKATEQFLYYFS